MSVSLSLSILYLICLLIRCLANALPESTTVLVNHRIAVEESVQDVKTHYRRIVDPWAQNLGLKFQDIEVHEEKFIKKEMVWKSSDDTETTQEGSMFTGVLWRDYGAPQGLCFDSRCGDDPVIDDSQLESFNLIYKANKLMNWIRDQGDSYGTKNIMLTLGGDFTYSNARLWYSNLDKLIEHVNERVNFL